MAAPATVGLSLNHFPIIARQETNAPFDADNASTCVSCIAGVFVDGGAIP
jgi:hypothetical protein